MRRQEEHVGSSEASRRFIRRGSLALSREEVMEGCRQMMAGHDRGTGRIVPGAKRRIAKHRAKPKARSPGQESWQEMIECGDLGQDEDGMSRNSTSI